MEPRHFNGPQKINICMHFMLRSGAAQNVSEGHHWPVCCTRIYALYESVTSLVTTGQQNQLFLCTKAPYLSSALPPESSTDCQDGPITHEETKLKLERRTRDKEEIETQREQVMWRLQRLLGDSCNEGRMTGVTHPPSDSICTEDFVRCFRDEMVGLALPVSNVQQLDKEEEAERTEILNCDTCQSEQKEHCILNVDRRGTAMTGESNKDTETAHYCQRKELEKWVYDSYGVNTSCSEQAGAGETYNPPQRLGDDGSSSEYSLYKLLLSMTTVPRILNLTHRTCLFLHLMGILP